MKQAQQRRGKIQLADAGKFSGDVRQARLQLQGQFVGNDLKISAQELQAR